MVDVATDRVPMSPVSAKVSISEISHLDKKLHIRRMDDMPALMCHFLTR